MGVETFKLNSREEVVRFEYLLDSYVKSKAHNALQHISLTKAYDQLQGHENGGRLFSALLDIQINFVLLYLDIIAVGSTWNSQFSKGKLEGGSVLDSEAKFFGKMDIHRFNTSYILRYRAIWDKIMGLIVLEHAPSDYDAFSKSKSKKKTFKKILDKCDQVSPEFIYGVNDLLTNFDHTFRTAEAHGTGSLRKYSFTM